MAAVTEAEGGRERGLVMKKLTKWVLGIAIILGAVAALLVATLDGDPATKPEIKETIEKVKEGVDVIRAEEEKVVE